MSMRCWRLPLGFHWTPSDTLICTRRSGCVFSTSIRRADEKDNVPSLPPKPAALEKAPRASGKIVEEFNPLPLDRPIGLTNQPHIGENTGIDGRTWRQRRQDFVNYDKHLVRRKQLTQKMATPYFREWSNMRHHKGKSFLAPPRLFKADKALYFPNMHGRTLVSSDGLKDTTPVLENHVSIVSIFSSAWAERQAASFVSEKNNPELKEIVKTNDDLAQIVQINVEENILKAMMIRLFMPSLRRTMAKTQWGRYFLVQMGLTDEIRDAIGLLNSKVGYVYVLDGACKIRWAGSGIAEGTERQGLNKGVKRLLDDARTRKVSQPTRP